MRGIKFRVWDNEDYMSTPFDLQDIQLGNIEFTKDSNLMQYTGLKDKNGKDIYENDYLETGGANVWCVFWGSGKYILHNISNGDIVDCNENNTRTTEVSGNTFESPREHKAMASDL